MKSYILKKDYEDVSLEGRENFRITSGNSVIAYKNCFFSYIQRHAPIISIDETIDKEELRRILEAPRAILISVNKTPRTELLRGVRLRHMTLSLGTLLCPQYLYEICGLSSAETHLLSTQFQAQRLQQVLGAYFPHTAVFPPRIDTDFFVPPAKRQRADARKRQGIHQGETHIVYAGRWLVDKGICQILRMLEVWHPDRCVFTFAGNVDEEQNISNTHYDHRGFGTFLAGEVSRCRNKNVRFQKAKKPEELRELFWSADMFINPSIQPDENFGVTAREAVACGVPVVTTNFCGLTPLADAMPWGGVDTYPTRHGSRFSLRALYQTLRSALKDTGGVSSTFLRSYVLKECDEETARKTVAESLRRVSSMPAELPRDRNEVERDIKRVLWEKADTRALSLVIEGRRKKTEGLYNGVDGEALSSYDGECLHHAFPLVQGLYSSATAPPVAAKDSKWRGFFRIGLWEKERAVVEFSFPAWRFRKYTATEWSSLTGCLIQEKGGDSIFMPRGKKQLSLVQGLIDAGYLVSDF
ncbi:MAG: glycosyltransferase family 4 protein [Candidatus Omnitrophica bacterium]|nr:glycosyltransferase family 4 protein [Candidatus Omnitrophota bacterium]